MFEINLPILGAFANVAIFAAAGLVNFSAPQSVRKVYDRWDVDPAFFRSLGLIEIIAALCLATPTLRAWGVALAMPIAFGSVVLLLDHRHYVYAASMVVMMSGLLVAILAIPQPPKFAFATPPAQVLVQNVGGSSTN